MGNTAKSPWTVMVGAAASIVAVVTAFTGPVTVIGAPTSTKPEALSIKALPDDGVTQFFLPLDAPLAELPHHGLCLPSTIGWLTEHGVKRPFFYLMSIRNEADSGPMLTIDNVRVVNKTVTAPQPGYIFVCSDQGAGETAVLNLDLDRDGPAKLEDSEDDTERPFAFNLEPGEAGSIDLRLHADIKGYSGRVVADVTGGGARAQVELALGENGGSFEFPGPGKSAGFFVAPGREPGEFLCELDAAESFECTPGEIRATATEMWSR